MSGLIINQFNAGYPKRAVIENLSTDILPRGKITVLLGKMGVVNQHYYAL